MLNDIIVAYSGTNPTWETTPVKNLIRLLKQIHLNFQVPL